VLWSPPSVANDQRQVPRKLFALWRRLDGARSGFHGAPDVAQGNIWGVLVPWLNVLGIAIDDCNTILLTI